MPYTQTSVQEEMNIIDNRPFQHSSKKRHQVKARNTGGPNSLHERGRDSCLRAVLCYKRLFTKACMGSIGFS